MAHRPRSLRRVGHLRFEPVGNPPPTWIGPREIFQPVYVAVGVTCDDETWADVEGHESRTWLAPLHEARTLVRDEINRALLDAIAPRLLAEMFAEAISRGDVDALGELMTDDHHLDMFEVEHVRGREARGRPPGLLLVVSDVSHPPALVRRHRQRHVPDRRAHDGLAPRAR